MKHQTQGSLAGMRVGSLFGIDVRLHFSVLVILALIVSSLATGLLPVWHPEWPASLTWIVAGAASLLFLLSLLVHEMSHALTARSCGIDTKAITFFLFGGVAELTKDADNPRDEFVIAGAGPLASFALALLFSVLGALLTPIDPSMGDTLNVQQLTPVATICVWLSAVNLMLATFNLVPGFPLDGGRMYRAFLWWRSGDMISATKRAASAGAIFGWVLVAWGCYRIFSADLVGGIWLVVIGWFLHRLAHASAAQIIMDRALGGFVVADLMRTRFDRVPSDLQVSTFLSDYFLRGSQNLWPVTLDGQDVGVVAGLELSQPTEGLAATVGERMVPLDQAGTLTPQTDARTALEELANSMKPVPVLEGGRVVGLLHHADVLRWAAVHKLGA